jgi:acyl-CoA synthetase (AMP-forming)/AMP-acid ligase II
LTGAESTVSGCLRRLASANPSASFCTFISGPEVEHITFDQLYRRSCAYAQHYAGMGIKPNDLILIILKHTPHLFYAYLGAMIAGAIPSYLPFPSPKQRADLYWEDHDTLFRRIQPRLVVTYKENLAAANEALPGFNIPTLVAGEDLVLAQPHIEDTFPGFACSADDVACLQHSSGTTSLKKGVMLTHRMILDHVTAYNESIGFGESDSIASWLPLYHDMGFIACFMGSLISGTHLVALDPFEWVMRPRTLLDAIQRYRSTFCWLPNFAFSHIANAVPAAERWDLSSIRAFINCSEPCKGKTFDRFAERFAESGITAEKLQICYAMAENVFGVTQTPLGLRVDEVAAEANAFSLEEVVPTDRDGIRLMSCGPPIAGVEVEIRDESGKCIPDGHIGEICVRGPFLFSGYYKLPEKTAEKLRDGWYYTGDMGFLVDGELFVTGRKDDMLIVAGRNYYAHEIEALVNALPEIVPGRNVAIGVEDPLTDATAVVVLAECVAGTDSEETGRALRREVVEKLGLAIHAFVPLSSGRLVKTTSGKISRSKNRELYVAGKL